MPPSPPLQTWSDQVRDGNGVSAGLAVSVTILDVLAQSGTLGAFNAIGAVLGVTTEVTDDGYFHLNIIDPAFDDASVSDTVTFRFDDGERIVHLK